MYRGWAHSICNLKFYVPKAIPVVFHNDSNYDYHFIIKELETNQRENWMPWGRYRKVQNLFCWNRKRSYRNLKRTQWKCCRTHLSLLIII